MHLRYSALVLLLVAALGSPAFGQSPVPTAGTHFCFGVLEGPDGAVPGGELQSDLYLTVLSQYSGCGLLVSPSGYSRQFSFLAGVPFRVTLDYALMQLGEQGKSSKGLLLTTSQPANVYFHDWTKSGGDATQIFPDEALDTSYVVGGWGLYNDPGEQNHACVMVVAAEDNTDLVVTPSVRTLAGQPAKQPIAVRLNRGETYSVKADISSQPSSTSLSGTSVSSTLPVAVFSGVTCAYVPIGIESCNEMLDQVLGKKWWSKHYLAQPLGNGDSTARLVLTSDKDFFASMNGAPAFSSNGRIETSFDKPVEITSNIPIQLQQTAGGSVLSGVGVGDPTLVTILGAEHYSDTLFWSIPNLGMANFAPIVVPTANIGQTLLDGQPLSSYGTPTVINGGAYSALRLSIFPGTHRLSSPSGVFTLGIGFDIFDAFSYVAGSVGPELPRDTVTRRLVVTMDSATTCDTFRVNISLDNPLTPLSGVTDLSPTVRYDPNLMYLVSFTPGAALAANMYVVDSSVPGVLRIQIIGKPLVVGQDLFTLVFFGKASGSAEFTNVLTAGACGEAEQVFRGGIVPFGIKPSDLAMPRTFSVPQSETLGLVSCVPYRFSVISDTTLTDRDHFVPLRIEYIHSQNEDLTSSTLSSLLASRFISERLQPDQYTTDLKLGPPVAGGDTLITFDITPTVAGSFTGTIKVYYKVCADTVEQTYTFNYTVNPNIDSVHARLAMSISPVTWGNESSATVTLSGLPIDAHVKDFTLDISYNHDVLTFFRTESSGTLTSGWQPSGPTPVAGNIERFRFTSSTSELGTSGPLVYLLFRTYVSDSASTSVAIGSSLVGSTMVGAGPTSCPILYTTGQNSVYYTGRDLCGDSLLRRLLNQEPIELTAMPMQSRAIDVNVESRVARQAVLTLVDLLGHTLESRAIEITPGATRVEFDTPIANGVYIVRLTSNGIIRSRRVSITR